MCLTSKTRLLQENQHVIIDLLCINSGVHRLTQPLVKLNSLLTLSLSLQGHRTSALWNIAGDMQTADIVPRAAGDFTLQCRTAEHVQAGMIASFYVESDGETFSCSLFS